MWLTSKETVVAVLTGVAGAAAVAAILWVLSA